MIIGIDGNEANSVRPDIKARVGVNQYAYGLLRALYETDKENTYQIWLEALPLPDLPAERENWKYVVTGPARFWTQWKLPLELFKTDSKPDVFFSPSHYAPRFSPVPTVVSIMDLGFFRFPEQFKKKDLWQLKSWTAYSVKKASQVITISKSTKKDVVSYYGVDPSKVTVTYPGYNKEKFNSQIPKGRIDKVKKKYEIKKDYLLFLSVLKPSKNVEGLVEAFAQVKDNDLQLVIAGSKGWLYETIFQKVKSLKLTNRVIFTDFVPDEDVPPLMAGAKAFVLPSYWEGFGIPVVEAMACGTPVVVSNVASLPEIVEDAGILVDPSDPSSIAEGIKRVVTLSENEYNKLVDKSYRQAQKFGWDKTAQKTLMALGGAI